MTDDEFNRLVKAADSRLTKDRPRPGERFIEFIRFLRITGARTIEAARLRWSDIDLEKAVITLEHHKTSSMQRQPQTPGHSPPAGNRLAADRHSQTQRARRLRLQQPSRHHLEPQQPVAPHAAVAGESRYPRGRQAVRPPPRLRHAGAIVNGVDLKTLAEPDGPRIDPHYRALSASSRSERTPSRRHAESKRSEFRFRKAATPGVSFGTVITGSSGVSASTRMVSMNASISEGVDKDSAAFSAAAETETAESAAGRTRGKSGLPKRL